MSIIINTELFSHSAQYRTRVIRQLKKTDYMLNELKKEGVKHEK